MLLLLLQLRSCARNSPADRLCSLRAACIKPDAGFAAEQCLCDERRIARVRGLAERGVQTARRDESGNGLRGLTARSRANRSR
jgi:hypothetical protein